MSKSESGRQIKFRIFKGEELIGIERVSGGDGWQWMAYAINPDVGERWTPGAMPLTSSIKGYYRDQFTGLLDKNGNEIYEGDLVSGTNGLYTFVVTYMRNGFIAVSKNGADEFTIPDHWEVIGNIHQNPELL